jgi:hypothetical protein
LDFNAALSGIVNTLNAQGKDVTLVDQVTPLNANVNLLMVVDNVLNLHANSAGNNVIAQQWFNAFQARAVPEPGSVALVGAGTAFLVGRRQRGRTARRSVCSNHLR